MTCSKTKHNRKTETTEMKYKVNNLLQNFSETRHHLQPRSKEIESPCISGQSSCKCNQGEASSLLVARGPCDPGGEAAQGWDSIS